MAEDYGNGYEGDDSDSGRNKRKNKPEKQKKEVQNWNDKVRDAYDQATDPESRKKANDSMKKAFGE